MALFGSSGKNGAALRGISFHRPWTICLLKQEDRGAKIHFEETPGFPRTDSVEFFFFFFLTAALVWI